MTAADGRRITLIARDPNRPTRDWDFTNLAGSRIVFVDALQFLPYAIDRGVQTPDYDLERVIIDCMGTERQFLELLGSLPYEFTGDILFFCADGRGFLSSQSRGDGRVVYTLAAGDVQFYLQTHGLTWALTAAPSFVNRAMA